MPRSGKVTAKPRHNPLHLDIQEDSDLTLGSVKAIERRLKPAKYLNEEGAEEVLDARSSAKVLELAQIQQKELDEDSEDDASDPDPDTHRDIFRLTRHTESGSEDEDENSMQIGEEVMLDIDTSDLSILDRLHPSDNVERKTLADVIFSKMAADGASATGPSTQRDVGSDPAVGLDPRIVELFKKVGDSMQGTGSLPKLIKVLPSFPSWQRYLALTQPEDWNPFSCRKATNIFVSNMKPKQAQFFFRYVLLPAVRENIATNRSLNVHYYEALLRSLFKPAAFFKGFLFPLLEENCTLKEATIVASVLAKKAIPPLHLGAAILHIAAADFSGARALFLRVLLDKKKDLPYRVLDDLVFHFIRISNWSQSKGVDLPVLWHQSLLVFSQRYSANLTRDQKDALLDVVKANFHHQIGPEVCRELACADNRPLATDIVMS
ncbi:putative bystin [Lyophyllum shimeji]|uniref:Bystin n=1 Tax=Lyophyllum shimeji TaxID=47721 RepID=A0A9P3PVE8_LYOSH|nr:putative bystin [Lyophyllum shimeji]